MPQALNHLYENYEYRVRKWVAVYIKGRRKLEFRAWVLKHSGIELHQLICELGCSLILIVYLKVHQILQFGSLLTSRPIRALSWCD